MKEELTFFSSWKDATQIRQLDGVLPTELRFEGEFGSEVVTFLPFIYNLHEHGLLRNRFISTYTGMRPYYYFLAPKMINQQQRNRYFLAFEDRWWPHSDERYRMKIEGEKYPTYQTKTKMPRRPLIFIQNKYCVEWGEKPLNYIPLPELQEIFELTKESHSIVYSRQGITTRQGRLGISLDQNTEMYFADEKICRQYKHVKILEKSRSLQSYNANKLNYINRAILLIGVQGGSTYPWAYFEKQAIILHVRGSESEFSYENGVFKFLSPSPLKLVVVRHASELLEKVKLHTQGKFSKYD